MRTCTRDIVYSQSRFFLGIPPMLKADLPSAAEIIALFEAAGLRSLTHQLVTHALATDWQQFTDRLALRADLFLTRLPDAEFDAGMANLRTHAAQSAPAQITEMIDFFVFELDGPTALGTNIRLSRDYAREARAFARTLPACRLPLSIRTFSGRGGSPHRRYATRVASPRAPSVWKGQQIR